MTASTSFSTGGSPSTGPSEDNCVRKQPFAEFVRETWLPLVKYGTLIPCTFILLLTSKIAILPLFVSDSISGPLSLVWPVLYDNYVTLKNSDHVIDAINYVAFVTVMLIYNSINISYVVHEFIKRRKRIEALSMKVHVVAIVGVICIIVIPTSDRVVFELKSLGYFYIDSFGLYFIREYVVFCSLLAYLILLLVTFIRVFDLIREKMRP